MEEAKTTPAKPGKKSTYPKYTIPAIILTCAGFLALFAIVMTGIEKPADTTLPMASGSLNKFMHNTTVTGWTIAASGKVTNINGSEIMIASGKDTLSFVITPTTLFTKQVSPNVAPQLFPSNFLKVGDTLDVKFYATSNGAPEAKVVMVTTASTNANFAPVAPDASTRTIPPPSAPPLQKAPKQQSKP